MNTEGKKKIFCAGVVIGFLFMLSGYLLLGKGQEKVAVLSSEELGEAESEITVAKREQSEDESETIEGSPERTDEQKSEPEEKYYKETDEQKEARKNRDGYMVSSNMKISSVFVRELYLYQYIEYGLRKYNEERQIDKDYFCDIEEDMLSYYAELGMEQEGAEPFKTDFCRS